MKSLSRFAFHTQKDGTHKCMGMFGNFPHERSGMDRAGEEESGERGFQISTKTHEGDCESMNPGWGDAKGSRAVTE